MKESLESKEKLKDCKNCLVCQSEPVNCLIKPCNHACICEQCSLKLEECPLDRKRIEHIEKIYLS